MVKKRAPIIIFASIILISILAMSAINAQSRVYRFNQQYSKIWINQDGTIDLFYNVSISLDSGPNINYVSLGQPNSVFTVGDASDQYGRQLQASKDGSAVKVNLYEPLVEGKTIWFAVITNVADLITPDYMNEGNLGMQFAPEWQQVPINDIRIQIVLPPNVTQNEVKTTESFWNGTSIEPDGRLSIYWETSVIGPNEQYIVGVSFPAQYLPDYGTPSVGQDDFFSYFGLILGIIGIITAIIVISVFASRKRTYQTPKLSIETLGIRRGLTAVEASYLLDLKPTQIVTEILYSLLQKRAIWVESVKLNLKVRIMPEFQNKKGPEETPLRYYEIDFLEAIKTDGSIEETKLAKTVMYLRDTLEEKLSGHNRKETINYYRKIVDKAWTQVDRASTAELASKTYDEQLLWLLLDPNYRARTETTFKARVFEPNPLWFWYWYGYTHYSSHPTYKPNITAPSQSTKPPTIPGAQFANNIATSLEQTSGNIVADIEKFVNGILPPPPTQTSHTPTKRDPNCVCACAACACACACVSCACACAGGGVG